MRFAEAQAGVAAIEASARAPSCVRSRCGGVPSRQPRRVGGFSLIEMLIVMAIIAIVVSLSLPSLGAVRRRSQELKSLTNLRTHVAMHSLYTGDFAGTFLYATDPSATRTVLRGGGHVVEIEYFMLRQAWSVPMADEYYGGDAAPDSIRVPWKELYYPPFGHYLYGDVFFSRPEYWDPETRRADTSQWLPVRIDEVVFPSAKGLMWERGDVPDSEGVFRTPPDVRVGLADGSATAVRYARLLSPYPYGPSNASPGGTPVLHTRGGVRGRDVP